MNTNNINNSIALRLVRPAESVQPAANVKPVERVNNPSYRPAAYFSSTAPELPSAVGDVRAQAVLDRVKNRLVGGETTVPIHFDQSARMPSQHPAVRAYSRFVADPASVNESRTTIDTRV